MSSHLGLAFAIENISYAHFIRDYQKIILDNIGIISYPFDYDEREFFKEENVIRLSHLVRESLTGLQIDAHSVSISIESNLAKLKRITLPPNLDEKGEIEHINWDLTQSLSLPPDEYVYHIAPNHFEYNSIYDTLVIAIQKKIIDFFVNARHANDDCGLHFVNVAFDASVDALSRQLTVNLEAYFTADGPSSVYVNVALIQDSIPGPQVNGSTYYPSNIVNGKYQHNHVLRHMLTGQWGEALTTTTMGSTYSNQYTYTLPSDINGIGLEMKQLKIVAFISTGTGSSSEIITGAGGPVIVNIPAGMQESDVASTSAMSYPSDLCQTSFTPKMTVTNNGSVVVDTFALSYDINGGTPVVQNFYNTQPLSPGASYTYTFPTVTMVDNSNVVNYYVNTDEDTTTIDLVSSNNSSSSNEFYMLNSLTSVGDVIIEGFEGNLTKEIEQDPTDMSFLMDQSASSSITWDIGAYENSATSYMWYFYNTQSGSSSLVFDKVDFSAHTGNKLYFSHAYAQYQSENDQLKIYVSTDCGVTWHIVYSKSGGQLATATATQSNFFPHAADWTTTEVDLSTYDGQSEVMIKFTGTSNYGNNLYVDDINITWPTGVEKLEEKQSLNVYPNPASDILNISVETLNERMTLEVYNSLGEKVYVSENVSLGTNLVTLDVSGFDNGIYYVNLKGEKNMISKRVTVLK